MAQPISRDWDRDAEFRPNNRQRSRGFERSQYGMDDEMPPQIPAGDKTRNRVWRAMSWVLLVNVVLFWLMTCVTAFAQTTASWASVYLMYSPASGSYTYTQNATPLPGWRSEGIRFRVKTDASAIDGQPAVALQKLTLPGLNRVVLTTDGNEVNNMRTQGWQSDGTLGYVGKTKTATTQPLHRITHDALKLNLYTTKAPGKNFLVGTFGWRYAGIAGYVMSATENGNGPSGTPPSLPSAPVANTAPTLTSFAPASAQSGATITITGSNFTAATTVKFNGVASAGVSSITATSLQATVPASATSGKISVTTPAGTATSAVDFSVLVAPTVVDATYRDAARFLTQATFGPKAASIDRVKAIGPSAWIDEQLARPADSHMAYIDAAKARRLAENGKAYYAEEDSYEAIWQQWLFGQDELRARMSFALTEIMVISNIAPDLEPDAMSSYMDMINARAFGNYRDLLGAVALHPAMGYYLNMLGSEKEDAAKQKFPNENFAREVLQLFSVGLNQLNADGTRKLDAAGVPLPTYDESVVKGFARAFTGWTFFGNDPANPKKFDRPEESWTQPMIAFASKHETGTKTLLNGVTLPAGQTPEADMKAALDNIANHPNVGPFIGRQLIQRFVTSNPNPAYVARVAAVFDNNGRGVRGDLAAVIKAVLLDTDARNAPLTSDTKFGKQREPVIRFANILRAFNATSANGRNNIHYLDSADDALGQSPLLSPSVFNFFSPAYTRPGRLAQAGMVAPEFQITNEIQTVGTANFFYQLVKNEGYGSGDNLLKLDLTQARALANSPVELVDYLSRLLTYGELNATTRQTIVDAVTAVPFNNNSSDRTWRVRTALTLFALSSDFVIQK
ncbi:MAG: DUF1800 family protein [Betaproteobacteria bacterium]|nr:DUF1800 family protein [Betaproteobacteria bacterium]